MTIRDEAGTYHPWSTYIAAREEARHLGDRRVGTDHLLLGLLRDPEVESLLGTSLDQARHALAALDNRALAAVGLPEVSVVPSSIDYPLPSRPTARLVLANRLRLTPAAAGALKEAGRPTRRGRAITPMRVLAALVENEAPDPGAVLLDALGIDRVRVRALIDDLGPDAE